MQNEKALVTVVIPTRNRPELVQRAVRSALAQTYANIEVIVVVDGPDPATVAALEVTRSTDSRLCVVALAQNLGGSDARNAGIKAANGEWIALLDDDDEWLPEKLEKQLALGLSSLHRLPVISCKIIARTPFTEYILPRKEPFLPVGDYILQRKSLFGAEGLLQTSTLVARRELFHKCFFTSGLPRHQDWDWLIRACEVPEVGLEFVPQPLSVWYVEENRVSISVTHDWRHSFDWVHKMRPHLSSETYAAFLLTDVSASASNQKDWSAFAPLLFNALSAGKPRAIHLALYFGMWIIPQKLRRLIRRLFTGGARGRK